MSSTPHASTSFDACSYWNNRLQDRPPLSATGTRPFDENYQRYLYRLKKIAIHRLLKPWQFKLHGGRVLNVGCGWGYFEPVFAEYGATDIMGIDFVESSIRELQLKQPQFEYHQVDITQPLPDHLHRRTFDCVTAIDMLYHIVDHEKFNRALGNLCSLCNPNGGLLLWTDAPNRRHNPNQPHCRYRNFDIYKGIFKQFGITMKNSVPMYCLYDVYNRWSEFWARHPRIMNPLTYTFDRMFAAYGWRSSTNYCALAVRRESEL